ncbi:MAG: PRTRC system protein C [Desulfobacteraceae bacterium]|nr:PRTRC system protein C [Desulfobacteraceae bacterium]
MSRVFVYDGREFPDPDPNLSVDEVRVSMSNFFPELSNAEVKESQRDSESEPGQKEPVYEFRRRVGVKG